VKKSHSLIGGAEDKTKKEGGRNRRKGRGILGQRRGKGGEERLREHIINLIEGAEARGTKRGFRKGGTSFSKV